VTPAPQEKIGEHERLTEQRAAALVREQARLVGEVDARLRLAGLQQSQAAELLADAADKIGRTTLFDK
jgi:hypothetical protein